MTQRKRSSQRQGKASRATKPGPGSSTPFTAEEREAMRDHAKEVRAARSGSRPGAGDGERDVLAKIAGMAPADRAMAERVHAIVRASAPELAPRLWYGMPAYALDGNVVCFFQGAQKFKTRYATFGFSDKAKLDEGRMWPNAFALAALTPTEEELIAALVKKAVRPSA